MSVIASSDTSDTAQISRRFLQKIQPIKNPSSEGVRTRKVSVSANALNRRASKIVTVDPTSHVDDRYAVANTLVNQASDNQCAQSIKILWTQAYELTPSIANLWCSRLCAIFESALVDVGKPRSATGKSSDRLTRSAFRLEYLARRILSNIRRLMRPFLLRRSRGLRALNGEPSGFTWARIRCCWLLAAGCWLRRSR